jgi:signal transduction histidine kinase
MIRWAPRTAVAHGVGTHPAGDRGAQAFSRFTAPERGIAFWVALWLAAAAGEFGALAPLLFEQGDPPGGADIVFSLVGFSFAACGLIAWHRRPDSNIGRLMTATGFALYVAPILSLIHSPAASTAANLLTDVWSVLFATLLLTFLTGGRLRSTVDRVLVGAFALPLVLLGPIWMLFWEDESNLLDVFPQADVAHALDTTQRSVLLAAMAATIVVLALRWQRANPPRRRALLPSIAGGVVLALFAALLVNDLLISDSRPETLVWLAACSIVSVPLVFLAGLLRSRLARGSLADLFRRLRSMRGAELQRALAKTLGDPDLTVAYRLPGRNAYVDAEGRPVSVVATPGERAVAPVERDGREIAALLYDAALDDDPELVEAVSAAAAIALENEQLQAESRARLAELRASRERLVAAGDAERRRLERNLHDGAQQRLVGLALQLRLLQDGIRQDPAAAERLAMSAGREVARSLEELRELARGIHPAVLDHGLPAALDSLAARCPVPTRVTCDLRERLPEQVELAAYFVASEALANVAKYAEATSVTIAVTRTYAKAIVEIADDGIGGADASAGSGLRGLADRVEALDGRLRIVSPRGIGTTVTAELPCGS